MTTLFDGVAVDSNIAVCSDKPVAHDWLNKGWKRFTMRIVWYVIWIGCMAGNIFWMVLLTSKYWAYEPQSTLLLRYGAQPFPAVSICPLAPLGKVAANAFPSYAAVESFMNGYSSDASLVGGDSAYSKAMMHQAAKQKAQRLAASQAAGQTLVPPPEADQGCKDSCKAAGGFIYSTSCYVLNKYPALSWGDAFCQCITKPPTGFARTTSDGDMQQGVGQAWVGLHKRQSNLNSDLRWFLGPDEPGQNLTKGATPDPGFCCIVGDCVRPFPLSNFWEDTLCAYQLWYVCEFGCLSDPDFKVANTSAPWAASECYNEQTTTPPPPTTTAYDPCGIPDRNFECEAKTKLAINDSMARDATGEDLKRSSLDDETFEDPNNGLNIDIMLKSCTYNGDICTKADFVPFIMLSMGRCWQFNYNPNDPKYSMLAGMHNGLRMHLYVNQSDNLDSQTTSGLLLGIGDVGRTTFVDNSRIWLSTGQQTSVQLSMKTYSRLGKPYGSCMEDNTKPYVLKASNGETVHYIFNDTYNVEACARSIMAHLCYTICNCSYPGLPNPLGHKRCDSNSKTEWDCYQKIQTANYSSINYGYTCIPECKINEYDYVYTSVAWPSSKQQLSSCYDKNGVNLYAYSNISCFEDFKMNNLMAEIGFETLAINVIEESPAYTLDSLLYDYTNIIGLCVGLSMINLVELIYYVCRFVLNGGTCLET